MKSKVYSFCCWKAGARTEINTVLPLYCSLPLSLPPHTNTLYSNGVFSRPQMIFSDCWALFVQWTQWLLKRSKPYYHIITEVIRALFVAHVALRSPGSVLERHSFSDRAFIYLQYIVPSFPYASPLSRGPFKAGCWCQYSRENEVQWWARGKAGIADHRRSQQVLYWFCF